MPATLTRSTAAVTYACKRCRKQGRKTVLQVVYDREVERYDDYRRPGTVRWYREGAEVLVCDTRSSWVPSVECPSCGAGHCLEGRRVRGQHNASVPCDARCTGATGHQCECSCGGKNHGSDWR